MHYTNNYSFRKRISCARDYKRYLLTLYHIIFCLSPFCLNFVLFHEALLLLHYLIWPRAQLHVKVPNHIYVLKWYIIHCLIYFYISFCLFSLKNNLHLGKVNKKIKTEWVSSWIDAQSSCLGFTSFNVPSCLLSKTPNKVLL